MKKTILFSIFFLFFGLVPHIFAQGFVPLAPIPGLTQGATADTAGLANFFNNLYKFAIGIASVLAIIMIIWGGLEYSTQDSISKKSDGKERIYNAIFGLILVLSPVLVFSIINPSILNLSINLKPLDTASVAQPTPACDFRSLTPEQRKNCETVEAARNEGMLFTSGEHKKKVIKAAKDLEEESAGPMADCKKNGGAVWRGPMFAKGCPEAVVKNAGYNTCTVLPNGSLCLATK